MFLSARSIATTAAVILASALILPGGLQAGSRGTDIEISRLLGKLRKEPTSAKLLTDLGAQFAMRASEQGYPSDVVDARQYLRQAQQIDPGNPVTAGWLGVLRCVEAKIRGSRGFVREGLSQLDAAVARAPDNLVLRMLRGSVDLEVPREFGRLEQGIAEMELLKGADEADRARLASVGLDRAEVFLKLGKGYRARGDMPGAQRMWQKVVAEGPPGRERETALRLLQKYGTVAVLGAPDGRAGAFGGVPGPDR
jgi:hypothetical protein